jgi:DGQHR domain-containing protein
MGTITVKALKVSQPIGSFYCFVIKAKDLVDITYSDVRRMSDLESRELDDYIGIQRPLSDSRVKNIMKYISGIDASFPNSIILSMSSKNVLWSDASSQLEIIYDANSEKNSLAKILDGQHRIAGFNDENIYFIDEEGNKADFELIVTVFVDADISTQANIFSTVNLAQTKVNKSLVYDLESLAYSRSPEKTCHDIAVLLNNDSSGPFSMRIKRLGVATPNIKNETLTQAAFVENLLKLITHDADADRNHFMAKERVGINKKNYPLEKTDSESFVKYPFRSHFINEKDSIIAGNVSNFFSAVSMLWPEAWSKNCKESSLNKTIGFIALMRVFKDICSYITKRHGMSLEMVISKEDFFFLLDGGGLDEGEFMQLDAVSKNSKKLYDIIKYNLALDTIDE